MYVENGIEKKCFFVCVQWMAAIFLQAKDAEEWAYRGEGAVNLVLAYCGSSPRFVCFFLFFFLIFFYDCVLDLQVILKLIIVNKHY